MPQPDRNTTRPAPKAEANLPQEHRCKNPQRRISEQSPGICNRAEGTFKKPTKSTSLRGERKPRGPITSRKKAFAEGAQQTRRGGPRVEGRGGSPAAPRPRRPPPPTSRPSFAPSGPPPRTPRPAAVREPLLRGPAPRPDPPAGSSRPQPAPPARRPPRTQVAMGRQAALLPDLLLTEHQPRSSGRHAFKLHAAAPAPAQ